LLKEKRVLILGLGREGESSFRFLRKYFPKKLVGLADAAELKNLSVSLQKLIRKDKNINLHFGKNYLKALKNYDIVIKSPGIPLKAVTPFAPKKCVITSQTEIFLERYKKQTIGITGTKGKGTTAGLICQILKNAGLKAKLIGNIVKPALDYFRKIPASQNKWFVFEMSSHQLAGLRISPHIAVFVNIYPDHLDYFKNFQEYLKAKANITKWQDSQNYFIFNSDFPELKKLAEKTKAKTIAFGKCKNFNCNILAAKKIASLFRISPEEIAKASNKFKNAEHRLEFVGKFKGINFYNDSASTIPESTLAAIDYLKNVQTIILGGSKKGSDFKTLARKIIEKKIKTIILFPEEGKKIWQEIIKQKKEGLPKCFFVNNMKKAVELCFEHTPKETICLLSPACASFTTFKNYQDRGRQFKKYIKATAKDKK